MIEQEFLTLIKSKTSWTCFLNHGVENIEAPYIVISKVSAPRSYTNDGRDGMVIARFQVNLYGLDYKTTKEEAYELYSVADYTSSNVSYIVLENEIDLYNDNSEYHQITLDFIVSHYE